MSNEIGKVGISAPADDHRLVVWTLDDAIAVIRELEPVASKAGYHLGITGGVLYRGYSKKDLDIVCYPHCTEVAPRREVMNQLGAAGITWHCRASHEEYGDDKIIEQWDFKGKSVDVFFLQ